MKKVIKAERHCQSELKGLVRMKWAFPVKIKVLAGCLHCLPEARNALRGDSEISRYLIDFNRLHCLYLDLSDRAAQPWKQHPHLQL